MKKWMKMTATMMAAAMALTACGGNDAAALFLDVMLYSLLKSLL